MNERVAATRGMGWIPDLPDTRDYTIGHPDVSNLLQKLPEITEQKEAVDLRVGEEGEPHFPLVQDQGMNNSSSAIATLSLLQYFERRTLGLAESYSSTFLYKVARNLRNHGTSMVGDRGVDLRTTFRALTKFGIPSEKLWQNEDSMIDREPGAFVYAASRPRDDIRYFRAIPEAVEPDARFEIAAAYLTAGFPLLMGFSVPLIHWNTEHLRIREGYDIVDGGAAMVAVGFKRFHFSQHEHGILVRTSWGKDWGQNGYVWASSYLLRQRQIRDIWTFVSPSWLNVEELSRPLTDRFT